MVNSTDPEPDCVGMPHLCHVLAVCLSFLICEREITTVPASWGCDDHEMGSYSESAWNNA